MSDKLPPSLAEESTETDLAASGDQPTIPRSPEIAVILAIADLVESWGDEAGHQQRIETYCRLLATDMQRLPRYQSLLTEHYIDAFCLASHLHDIGKARIPDFVLRNPGRLSPEEFSIMKKHTLIGASALRPVVESFPDNLFVRLALDIAECHHERWDGSGYPHGLAGERIPLAGRMLALCDFYDAMTSRRSHRPAFSPDKVKELIVSLRGRHFDPDIVDSFLRVEDRFRGIAGT